jgi:hypothetical protein
MTQFAVRIRSILLICVAATPVVADRVAERPLGAAAYTLVVVACPIFPHHISRRLSLSPPQLGRIVSHDRGTCSNMSLPATWAPRRCWDQCGRFLDPRIKLLTRLLFQASIGLGRAKSFAIRSS